MKLNQNKFQMIFIIKMLQMQNKILLKMYNNSFHKNKINKKIIIN